MANGKSCSSRRRRAFEDQRHRARVTKLPINHRMTNGKGISHQWIRARNVTTKYKSSFCCTLGSLQLLSKFGPILGNIYIPHRFKSVNCAMVMKVQGRDGKQTGTSYDCMPGYSVLFLHPTQGLTERGGVLILLSAAPVDVVCECCVPLTVRFSQSLSPWMRPLSVSSPFSSSCLKLALGECSAALVQ